MVSRWKVTLTIADLSIEREHPGYRAERIAEYITDAHNFAHAGARAGAEISLKDSEVIRNADARGVPVMGNPLTNDPTFHSRFGSSNRPGDADRE